MLQAWVHFLYVFVVDGFVMGFCRHVLLPLELLLVGAILLGLGRPLGLPLLFWHEIKWRQFLAGLAVVLLAAEVLFVGYLIDRTERPDSAWARAAAALGSSQEYPNDPATLAIHYLLGGAISLAAIGIVLTAGWFVYRRVTLGRRIALMGPEKATSEAPGDPFCLRLPLLVGATMALLTIIAATWIVSRFCAEIATTTDGSHPLSGTAQRLAYHLTPVRSDGAIPSQSEQPWHLLAAVIFIAMGIHYLFGTLGRWGLLATPATAFCTLLGLIAAVYGFLVSRDLHPLALLAVLMVLLGVAGIPQYKTRFRSLRRRYRRGAKVEVYPAGEPNESLLRTEDILWAGPSGGKRPLAIVCASGGGIRAAAWTVAVLNELARVIDDFPYHVRLIAGASGGMVGASLYVSSLRSPADAKTDGRTHELLPREKESDAECLYRMASEDSLSYVVKRWIFRDLPMMFFPWPYYGDRGEVLEETWRDNMQPAFDKSFSDLRPGEAAGWRPSLVFSPMFAEDGRRLFISNLDLSFLTYSEGHAVGNRVGDPVQMTTHFYSRDSYEFARIFPESWPSFPVRTAARMNASFPFVSTAAVLPTRPRRRVVDAGYFDNYGANIAAGWLVQLLESQEDWLKQVSGIVLIQIRDGVDRLSGEKVDFSYGREPGLISRGMEEVTSPLMGLFSAREAVQLFRNDEQVEALSALFRVRFDPDFFTTATFEFGGEASLSWYLTQQERKAIAENARALLD